VHRGEALSLLNDPGGLLVEGATCVVTVTDLNNPGVLVSPLQSLMSTTAFGLGSKYFALYEVAGVGIQWRTISQSPVEGDDFNLGLSMMMLIIDAAVYGVLTWYIEAVHPGMNAHHPVVNVQLVSSGGLSQRCVFPSPTGMYGLPRPWYFPLQRSYWSGSGRVETWDWPWCGGGAARLSVMEEDQACAMDQRRSGKNT